MHRWPLVSALLGVEGGGRQAHGEPRARDQPVRRQRVQRASRAASDRSRRDRPRSSTRAADSYADASATGCCASSPRDGAPTPVGDAADRSLARGDADALVGPPCLGARRPRRDVSHTSTSSATTISTCSSPNASNFRPRARARCVKRPNNFEGTRMQSPSYAAGPTPSRCSERRSVRTSIARITTFPDRDALVVPFQDVRYTYREFGADVDRVARGLFAIGVERGDRVGIWSPNNAEWVVLQYATAEARRDPRQHQPCVSRQRARVRRSSSPGAACSFAATEFKSSDYRAWSTRSARARRTRAGRVPRYARLGCPPRGRRRGRRRRPRAGGRPS